MEEGNTQKELFNFNDKPRKRFANLAGLIPKADLEGKVAVTLTLDKIIFIVIAVIMLMVVIFALGVENGKALVKPSISIAMPTQGSMTVQPVKTMPALSSSKAQATATLQATTIKIKTMPIAKVAPMPMGTALDRPAGHFTIVAATFKNKDAAIREAGVLRQKGFDAAIVKSDQYFKVCIGAYANRESAQATLRRVKQIRADAYIK